MENQKNNKGVITLLVVIIVMLSVLCILFATGTISFNSNKSNNNDINENNNDMVDSSVDDVVDNQNESLNNDVLLKQDVRLEGLGCSKDISAYIDNGNIIVAGKLGSFKIMTTDAKYIFALPYMECDTYYMFYITEDGGLHRFSLNDLATLNVYKEHVELKLSNLNESYRILSDSNSSIVGFYDVSNERKNENGDSYTLYKISVLDEDGSQKTFVYNIVY